MFGVNLSGAEWRDEILPGQLGIDYTIHSERSYQYWASKALGLIRLAFRWERLQPGLHGPLDPFYLSLLRQNARWAERSGVRLIIQPHNFGRYRILEGASATNTSSMTTRSSASRESPGTRLRICGLASPKSSATMPVSTATTS